MPMSRTRIKFCGFTREADVDAAVALGADAVGLVFYPPSKRCLTLETAARLRARVPPFVSVVALTVNASPAELQAIIDAVRPDMLQFHGDETPDQCTVHGLPYLRAFRVGAPGLDTPAALLESCLVHEAAAGWLFDSYSPGYGGSGRSFDWSSLANVARSESARPLVLSGGLHAERVSQALADVRPYAVDVSSGVELEPGVKCAGKMRQFAEEVRRFDAARKDT
nr:phosphoribosylanthranilate isomerase [Verticiella sp. GG226]